MNVFRGAAILLTQLPLLLFVGAKYDLLFGFNRMDSGFGFLLLLFLFVPLLNLSWLAVEVVRSVKRSRQQSWATSLLTPLLPAFFLLESIAVDLYIASHAKM